MAYQHYVNLQNLSDVEQTVVYEGRIESIKPYATIEVHNELARKFLDDRPRWVREYQPVNIPPIAAGDVGCQ